MSIATMIDHPLIAAAITDEGLEYMGIEERLEAGQVFTYGGAPRDGLIMKMGINAAPDAIVVRYVTQRQVEVTVSVWSEGATTLDLTGLPPETLINAMPGLPLAEVVGIPGGDGFTVKSTEIHGQSLRLVLD